MSVLFLLCLLITPSTYACLCDCLWGSRVETTTITIEHVLPARPANPLEKNHLPLSKLQTLTVPKQIPPRTKYSFTRTHNVNPPPYVDASPPSYADAASPHDQSMDNRKTLTPCIQSLPGTPLSPITSSDDTPPSSPETPFVLYEPKTPLFEERRIITYPDEIQDEQREDRYELATALAKAFIQRKSEIFNCIQKNDNKLDPGSLKLKYLSRNGYKKFYSIGLEKERFETLESLINSGHIHTDDQDLTYDQAEAIMGIISVHLRSSATQQRVIGRSLKQEMFEKYVSEDRIDAMREETDGLSLAQATQTIVPGFTPLGFTPSQNPE